jgi:hypothetical protein
MRKKEEKEMRKKEVRRRKEKERNQPVTIKTDTHRNSFMMVSPSTIIRQYQLL